MLTREQVKELIQGWACFAYDRCVGHSETEEVRTEVQSLLDHDAALRAEIEHYRDAIEVLQSARDCMLAGFTTIAASYQQGKMALRRIPDLEQEIERLTQRIKELEDERI